MLTIFDAAALDVPAVYSSEGTSAGGLTTLESQRRLDQFGQNRLGERRVTAVAVLGRQLRNPLLALLVGTAIVSVFLGEHTDAYIIISIIALSVGLGFFNEYRSERAMADLHRKIAHRAIALRDGHPMEVDVGVLVPGDVVVLGVGDIVPADMRLVEATGLTCGEAVLTGESAPSEKSIAPVRSHSLSELDCLAFMGTTVETGTARGVVIATGRITQFGMIAAHLADHPPETAFEVGLRGFSQMLVIVTLILTASIFVLNALFRHPIFDSLLFSLAIAVGLTPQLLPAIVTVSLATGAQRLAKRKVIVKRLVSIEDFGNVEILFTDKTGTLTEGRLEFVRAVDDRGEPQQAVFQLGLTCNDVAVSSAGLAGGTPLDRALWEHALALHDSPEGIARLSVAPFDYDRKLMSVLVTAGDGKPVMITKGAPEAVIARCADVDPCSNVVLDKIFESGARVVAVATRELPVQKTITPADECELQLRGFLVFADPVKQSAKTGIALLERLGVDVRIITGDNEKVAVKVCVDLGLHVDSILTGAQIETLTDPELRAALPSTSIFARVTPEQKSRIVRLQREGGKDVGFLGDGVNDAVALHYADVGISVDSAADVAKDAADIILLDKDLEILAEGVMEGRRIFSNTIKYVLMGTSSNFGNMFSAAGASLFLPFLPMTAPQILLNNLLYDFSEMAIPSDNVDEELLSRPSRWDVSFIRRFMIVFGPVSSIFDYMTFAVMWFVFHAGASLFQSAWFAESLATQSLIIFVIRTRRIPFFRSRPSMPLLLATAAVAMVGLALPFTPAAKIFGFVPLPPLFLAILVAMIVSYLILVDVAKWYFYRPPVQQRQAEARDRLRLGRVASRWID